MTLKSPADGQLIAAIIEILDEVPQPHPAFNAPVSTTPLSIKKEIPSQAELIHSQRRFRLIILHTTFMFPLPGFR